MGQEAEFLEAGPHKKVIDLNSKEPVRPEKISERKVGEIGGLEEKTKREARQAVEKREAAKQLTVHCSVL